MGARDAKCFTMLRTVSHSKELSCLKCQCPLTNAVECEMGASMTEIAFLN